MPGMVSGLLAGGGSALPADVNYMVNRYMSGDRHTALLEVELSEHGSSDTGRDVVAHLRDMFCPASFAAGHGILYRRRDNRGDGIRPKRLKTACCRRLGSCSF